MPYKPVQKKKAAPKGGGKAASGYNLYTPVKQSTIDSIKKMGMTAALKKAGSSTNAEFLQGVRRMYGANRLKQAIGANKSVAKSPDAARASVKPAKPVAKSPDQARANASAASKKVIGVKPSPNKLPYYYTKEEAAYVRAYGKPKSAKKSTSSTKPTASQVAYAKARAGGR
jgi:hypothetical protein